ncbi:MAG TPA: hypothetical protein VGO68_17600 [Pyrinomonadaceae bacterium]|jgi:hypothetical protein|nr:hypothetical protein [Pyrinomonadaceae bacterium]
MNRLDDSVGLRASGRVYVEDIIDDELDLPAKLPGNVQRNNPNRVTKSRHAR